MLSLVLVYVFNFNLFEFSAAILENGLLVYFSLSGAFTSQIHVCSKVTPLLIIIGILIHSADVCTLAMV